MTKKELMKQLAKAEWMVKAADPKRHARVYRENLINVKLLRMALAC